MDRHITEDGSEYVYIVFGLDDGSSSSSSSSDEEEEEEEGDKGGAVAAPAVAGKEGSAAAAAGGEGTEQPGVDDEDSSSSSSDDDEEVAAAGKDGSRGGRKQGRSKQEVDPSTIIDAEFIFPKDDNIVNARAASRAEPRFETGRLALSFEQGVVFEKNLARRQLEALRKALRWEVRGCVVCCVLFVRLSANLSPIHPFPC